jgi:hypothetical protein
MNHCEGKDAHAAKNCRTDACHNAVRLLTMSLIFFGVVPLLLRGYNLILMITFSICFGVGKKSISACVMMAMLKSITQKRIWQ